jgi:hypothetical protein
MQHAPVGAVARPIAGIRKHAANFSGDYLTTVLGELEVLRYAGAHHRPGGLQYAATIDAEIVRRTGLAIDCAFGEGRLDIVRALARSTPLGRKSLKLRTKLALAELPDKVARRLGDSLGLAARVLNL